MKTISITTLADWSAYHFAHWFHKWGIVGALAVLIGLNCDIATGQGEAVANDVQGAEVLTRGPVHEAFAGVVSFNAEPGVVVDKLPPEAIEELPPEERPEGDNITWIPGYWAWDDERSDFMWISGTWRALPPGREWIAGYWTTVPEGYQWISGYWADATIEETTYLPQPPATVESGPNVAAPSPDYAWTPGNWAWNDERYAWRPGYWAEGRTDWEWTPAHYVWTPRGYIFVDGYWDYGIARRGVLFAPVYFESGVYSQPGYRYSPRVAINLLAFVENLFLRPRYHHYYFGDYYEPRYQQSGFYSPFAFQSDHHGYDPVYSHLRWQHRQDRDWERNFETSYQYRRDHESARPPRTWAAQRTRKADAGQQELRMATTFDQMTRKKGGSLKFESVPGTERQKLAQRGHDIQKSREGRQALEAKTHETTGGESGREIKPTRVKRPKSSIVGKPSSKLEKKQAPPKPQQAPRPTTKGQPKTQGTDHQPDADKTKPKRQPKADKKESKPSPARDETTPAGKVKKPAPERQTKEPPAKPRQEPQRPSAKSERKAQPQPQRPTKNVEQPRTRKPSQPDSGHTEKPQQESSKPRGKGASTPEADDEKDKGKSSKKGSR